MAINLSAFALPVKTVPHKQFGDTYWHLIFLPYEYLVMKFAWHRLIGLSQAIY